MTEDDHDRRIPRLDRSIKKAANHDMLVLFVGAGVSRLVGCKGWDQLALDLVDQCYEKKFIHYKAAKELKSLSDHRQVITICYHLMEKNDAENLFHEEMKCALEPDEAKFGKFGDVFSYLSTMQHLCIVTTNADVNLDRCFPDKKCVVVKQDEFPPDPQAGYLYHLHGSISEGNEIFTLKQYFDLYHKDRDNIQSFLNHLFGEYHILFLGYGLSEFELLEFIFRKPRNGDSAPYRHFMLIDDSAGSCRKPYLQSYYKDMGIKLISYNSDICGYDQLYYVIKEWSQQLQSTPQFVRLTNDQEQLHKLATQEYNETSARNAWKLLQRPDLQAYFFDVLSDSSHDVRCSWLDPLDRHEHFSPIHHPSLSPENAVGSLGDVFWTPIGYLHKTIASAVKSRDTKTLSTIANIGVKLMQVPIKDPSRTYDWRTNHFILEALTVGRKVLSQPDMAKATRNLMITASMGLSFRMAVSEDLVTLLVHQRNNLALEMILETFLRGMAKPSGEPQRHLVWTFEKTLVPRAADLVRVGGSEIVQMCAARLRSWQRGLRPRTTTYFEVGSIEESSQSQDQGVSAPTAIVRFLRDACEQLPSLGLMALIQQFLAPRAPSILRRIGYYLVSMHYDAAAPLFWTMKRNPLSDEDAFHEVFMLLASHASSMDSKQIGTVLQWMKRASSAWRNGIVQEDNASKKALLKNQFMAKWLLALRTSPDMRIQSLFKVHWEGRSLPDHPEWNLYVGEVERGSGREITAPVLRGFETNEQLAAFLNSSDVSDTYSALRDMASSDPGTLVMKGLSSLAEIPIDLVEAIFNGLEMAIRNKRPFAVAPVLELGKSALSRLQEPLTGATQREDRKGTCRSICELVSLAASYNLIPSIGEKKLAKEVAWQAVEVAAQYPVTDSKLIESGWRLSNSALAAAIQATIRVAWRYATITRKRDQGSSHLPKWATTVLEKALNSYDPRLQIEAREGIAGVLYVLNVIDSNWVKQNVDVVFPKELPDQLQDAFAAYLAAPVYKELFLLLREKGVYSLAIEQHTMRENTGRLLAAHVSLAYTSGLDDGLIDAMLAHGDRGQLSAIIWYLANRKRKWTTEGRERLLRLWPKMIKAIHQLPKREDQADLLNELPTWLNAFPKLPIGVEDLLEESFDSWQQHCSSAEPDIVESLARSVEQDAERVGNLLLSALKKDVVLIYPEDVLMKIVDTLCERGLLDVAREIHSEYSKRGTYVLLSVLAKWEKP